MKKKDRVLKNIAENKELQKDQRKLSHYSDEQFYNDALRYISAIKQGRVICNIESVSSTGMSRVIKFFECHKIQNTYDKKVRYSYYNFHAFFIMMGYERAGKYKDGFRIHGCGMDMIFHTNYTNIHRLRRLGFINQKQCDSLAQMTPTVI